MKHGLPECVSIAVGVDLLLMAIIGLEDIRDVLTFPIGRA
ncbi:MAG: hypothetical protein IIA99_06145 [Proteobacteria bacterium]|nr:hypothetical protein [Pseudomonadota bacterium]MCH8263699.1 hypothetical protein [Pseudomonadota bacterium]